MSNNDHNFLRQLMKRIVESHQIPKVQVERVITPILSLFIADVLTKKFENNELLKGKYEFGSVEFPIKKENNYGSTNVDFLLFNTTTLSMVFLEVKTDSNSWDSFQFEKYITVREEVKKYGSGFLLRNLDLIERRSSRSDKYKVLQKSISSFEKLMVKSVDLKLLYLSPKKLKSKLINDGRLDFVMTFSELPDKIDGELKEEWLIVREALIELDFNMEESGFDDSLSDTPMYTPRRNVSTFSNRNGNEKMEVRVRRQIEEHCSQHFPGVTPKYVQFGATSEGGSPNYQVLFSNGKLVPFYNSGTEYKRANHFKSGNLQPRILWDDLGKE